MRNILRKVRIKLLAENKFGKYLRYWIGEVILVVVGILIALQINAWNQQRLDRVEEASLLSELHYEFEQNQIIVEDLLTVLDGAQEANRYLMKLMGSSAEELEQHNLDSIFYRSLPSLKFTYSEQSISNIIQGGKLNIIQDKKIIDLLYRWEAQLDVVKTRHHRLHTWSSDKNMSFIAKYISFKEMDSYGKFRWTGKSALKKDYYPLFQSLEYENILANYLWLHKENYDELKQAAAIIREILAITDRYTE